MYSQFINVWMSTDILFPVNPIVLWDVMLKLVFLLPLSGNILKIKCCFSLFEWVSIYFPSKHMFISLDRIGMICVVFKLLLSWDAAFAWLLSTVCCLHSWHVGIETLCWMQLLSCWKSKNILGLIWKSPKICKDQCVL